jgi:hypothetical protein
LLDRIGKRLGIAKPASAFAIDTNKIGITKTARCREPILLAATPEVATAKPAEDCWSAGMPTLALQGVEHLLHRVTHRR